MTDAVPIAVHPTTPGRRTKFTPERIQQIINLVERGKKREEIADMIGISTAALQVACSRLGVSLRRRPPTDSGVNFLPRRRAESETYNGETSAAGQDTNSMGPNRGNDASIAGNLTKDNAVLQQRENNELASFEIRMRYRGQERVTELPLDQNMIRYLALEAEFRGMRMGELITKLIIDNCKERKQASSQSRA